MCSAEEPQNRRKTFLHKYFSSSHFEEGQTLPFLKSSWNYRIWTGKWGGEADGDDTIRRRRNILMRHIFEVFIFKATIEKLGGNTHVWEMFFIITSIWKSSTLLKKGVLHQVTGNKKTRNTRIQAGIMHFLSPLSVWSHLNVVPVFRKKKNNRTELSYFIDEILKYENI